MLKVSFLQYQDFIIVNREEANPPFPGTLNLFAIWIDINITTHITVDIFYVQKENINYINKRRFLVRNTFSDAKYEPQRNSFKITAVESTSTNNNEPFADTNTLTSFVSMKRVLTKKSNYIFWMEIYCICYIFNETTYAGRNYIERLSPYSIGK